MLQLAILLHDLGQEDRDHLVELVAGRDVLFGFENLQGFLLIYLLTVSMFTLATEAYDAIITRV